MALATKVEILTSENISAIAKEVAELNIKNIFASQENLKTFINRGLSAIATLEKDSSSNENLQLIIKELFRIIVQIREYFTGEQYVLNVETENAKTIEVNFQELINNQAFIIKNNQVEYNLSLLEQQLQIINIHEELYDALVKRLFPPHCTDGINASLFMYKHSNKVVDKGHFFDNKFAHYQTAASSFAHFFIQKMNKENNKPYTSKNAKFYNRGHVYEWYIEDLNKDNLENAKEIDPVEFMQKHKKDNVPFIRAGDITRKKNEQIQAVQIKRFNNHRLMTCKQIRTVLNKLNGLTSSRLTEEKAKEIIENTFLTRGDKDFQNVARQKIEKALKEIFPDISF